MSNAEIIRAQRWEVARGRALQTLQRYHGENPDERDELGRFSSIGGDGSGSAASKLASEPQVRLVPAYATQSQQQASQKSLDHVKAAIAALPESHREILKDVSVSIVYSNKDFPHPKLMDAYGFYNPKDQSISVCETFQLAYSHEGREHKVDLPVSNFAACVAHEFGHAYDYVSGWPSWSHGRSIAQKQSVAEAKGAMTWREHKDGARWLDDPAELFAELYSLAYTPAGRRSDGIYFGGMSYERASKIWAKPLDEVRSLGVTKSALQTLQRYHGENPDERDERGRFAPAGSGGGAAEEKPQVTEKPESRGRWTSSGSLAAEARKAGSFENFERDFSLDAKHGIYWHWTNEKDFKIDPTKGPRDLSSMAGGETDIGALMITSDLEAWSSYGPGGKERPYVAQIDMRDVPRKEYHQVKRGFGNEFYVGNPFQAKVVRVVSPAEARRLDQAHDRWLESMFTSDDDLRRFYDAAVAFKKYYGEKPGERDEQGRFAIGGGASTPAEVPGHGTITGITDKPNTISGKSIKGMPENAVINSRQIRAAMDRGAFDFEAKPAKIGQFEATDSKYTLTITPKIPAGIQSYETSNFLDDAGAYYDPKLATLVTDAFGDEGEYKRIYAKPKPGFDTEIEPLADKNVIYRGISYEEMQSIRETGEVKSRGEYNIGDKQRGLTYYTTDAVSAADYASGFAPWMYKATFDRPAYVVAVRKPEEVRDVPGTGEHEVGVSRAMTTDEIVAVWRGDAYEVRPAEIDLRRGRGDEFSQGSGSGIRSSVVWSKVYAKTGEGSSVGQLKLFENDYIERGGWKEEDRDRVPAGSPEGGQFTSGGGAGGSAEKPEAATAAGAERHDGGVPITFNRRSSSDAERVRGVVAVFEPSTETRDALSQAGITPLSYEESGAGGAGRFHEAIAAAKQGKYAAAVSVYSQQDYASMRTFLTPDGKAGFALKGDEIMSAFKHPGSDAEGFAATALALATQQGGTRLDAYDTVLPSIYSESGFRAVARLAWDDQYAPDDWSKDTFNRFNGGEPDVVFMVHDPASAAAYRPSDGAVVADYDAGVAAQRAALKLLNKALSASRVRAQRWDVALARALGLLGRFKQKREFREEDVNRDELGRFSTGGGGGETMPLAAPMGVAATAFGGVVRSSDPGKELAKRWSSELETKISAVEASLAEAHTTSFELRQLYRMQRAVAQYERGLGDRQQVNFQYSDDDKKELRAAALTFVNPDTKIARIADAGGTSVEALTSVLSDAMAEAWDSGAVQVLSSVLPHDADDIKAHEDAGFTRGEIGGAGYMQMKWGREPTKEELEVERQREEKIRAEKYKKVTEFYRDTAKVLDFDAGKISLSANDGSENFTLNGRQFKALGVAHTVNPDPRIQGTIKLYPDQMTSSWWDRGKQEIEGVTAHEIQHIKFQNALDKYEAEWLSATGFMQASGDGPLKAGDELPPELRDRYPTYTAINDALKKYEPQDFAETDGVSSYSREYWKQFENNKTPNNYQSAVHETLAEMAKAKYTTGRFPNHVLSAATLQAEWLEEPHEAGRVAATVAEGTERWRNLYNAVEKIYQIGQQQATSKSLLQSLTRDSADVIRLQRWELTQMRAFGLLQRYHGENPDERDEAGKFAPKGDGGGSDGAPQAMAKPAKESGAKAQRAAWAKTVKTTMDEIAKQQDVDPEMIKIKQTGGKSLKIGGVNYDESAVFDPDKGTITVYADMIHDEDYAREVIAHEIMHVKSTDAFGKYFESKAFRRHTGQPSDAEEAMEKAFFKHPQKAFAETDGVSDYSAAYWQDWADEKLPMYKRDKYDIAVNETLSEMAAFKQQHGYLPTPRGQDISMLISHGKESGSERWQNLYETIEKVYKMDE